MRSTASRWVFEGGTSNRYRLAALARTASRSLPQRCRDPRFKGSSWKGSDYHYAWRTGNLLQTFDLSLSGPGVSEETARDYAEAMDALTER